MHRRDTNKHPSIPRGETKLKKDWRGILNGSAHVSHTGATYISGENHGKHVND